MYMYFKIMLAVYLLKGRLVAIDKTPSKIKKIQDNCALWSSSIVDAYAFDSTRIIDESAGDRCSFMSYFSFCSCML